jgi:(2R)-3-sulfolactate dehydrogenase (NADP+)
VPQVLHRKGGALLVDAQEGLAFPACELAVREGGGRARDARRGLRRRGAQPPLRRGGRPPARCGCAGMVGLGFANSPAAMPAAGGRHPIFGTNPVAAVFPRRPGDPLMIDLSLSKSRAAS